MFSNNLPILALLNKYNQSNDPGLKLRMNKIMES